MQTLPIHKGNCLSDRPSTVNFIFLQKVDAESPRRGRRSNVLKVAMTFPSKKVARKRPASEPLPQPEVHKSEDEEEEEDFMSKRDLNIKENKEMV